MDEIEPTAKIREIEQAEARLFDTVRRLEESDLEVASLCEGWTRGHILAHVALNAHSLVNLFEWARTGEKRPQYASRETRAADIERCSTRTISEHIGALEEASDAFFTAARAMPPDRWSFEVSGIGGGGSLPVSEWLFARQRELEVHHVDLDAGYRPVDWPEPFVEECLRDMRYRYDELEPAFEVVATDADVRVAIGIGSPESKIAGLGYELLAWLLGRSDGDVLTVESGRLPTLPAFG